MMTDWRGAPRQVGGNERQLAPARRILRALRRFFWMDERVARARERRYGRGRPGWEEFQFGRAVLHDATLLSEPADGRTAALVLYRSAAAQLVRAQVARAGIDLEPTAAIDQCWARLAGHASVASVVADTTEEERSLINLVFSPQGEASLARLPRERRARAARALSKLARGLAAPIEAEVRRLRSLLLLRWARIGVAALALLLVVWRLTAGFRGPPPGPNLALHRWVIGSSSFKIEPTNPAQLVDGARTNLGFHSEKGPNQYVIIDLGSVRRISRVDVYNRSNCCQERAIPLRIEVSLDQMTYWQVALRNEPFEVWKAKFPATQARYIRLTDLKNDYFHLSEVEVY